MYGVTESSRYKKSHKRVSQYKNFDQVALNKIVNALIRGEQLALHNYDHELKGKYVGIRECHVKNDLLLLYEKRDDVLILLLVDIGTHASVFGE